MNQQSAPHPPRTLQLSILLPTEVLLQEQVTRVRADGEDGEFCLLPRHVDFLSALVPGILTFTTVDQRQHYVAVGEGILVKSGTDVRVSTRHAVQGTDLSSLQRLVSQQFQLIDDRERVARSAIAKLEADFVRRFLQLEDPGRV